MLDVLVEAGELDAMAAGLEASAGVVVTSEVYEGPAEDFAAKLALSATAALAVASLF